MRLSLNELLAGPTLTTDVTTPRLFIKPPTLREILAGKDPVPLMPNETSAPAPKTPEQVFAEKFPATARLYEVKQSADDIERFVEWLESSKRLTLMTQIAAKKFSKSSESLESLVASFFGLDLAAVEAEGPAVEAYYEEQERLRLEAERAAERAFAEMNAEGARVAAGLDVGSPAASAE